MLSQILKLIKPIVETKFLVKFQQEKVKGDEMYRKLFYEFSIEEKKKYLEFDYSQNFIDELNQVGEDIGNILATFFLTAQEPKNWIEIRNLILEKGGFIGPILKKNAGDARFMNLLYKYTDTQGPLDKFLTNCLSGQAVNNRKKSVVRHSLQFMKNGRERLLLNLGSGYGYDSIEIAKIFQKTKVINVEIDPEVVEKGEQILKQSENNFQNISFQCRDMAKVRLEKRADYAWVIGVLCSFSQEQSIRYLSLFRRRYMKKEGILWGACATSQMVNQDLFTSFVLEEILDWHLYYRTYADVKEIFEKAGYKWRQDLLFSESEKKFYIVGAGEA